MPPNLLAATAAAAAVEVEQSFIFGHAAIIWPKTAKFLRWNSHFQLRVRYSDNGHSSATHVKSNLASHNCSTSSKIQINKT